MKVKSKKALGFMLAAAGGVVLAANPNWFTVNTAYGTSGVSAPLGSVSYGRAQAVDHNDALHRAYSLVAALPKDTISYPGPYTIVRRTSTGTLDGTFGAGGVTTSFANYNVRTYNFHALCIDPLTHNLIVIGDIRGTTTVIERLTPPPGTGVAALDATFNPQGATPGIVTMNGPLGAQACSVTGDQAIIIAGRDSSTTPNSALITRLLVDGTVDSSFGANGLVKIPPPNGENWESGSVAWNSSQTITPDLIIAGDTYPGSSQSSSTAALIALNACTGVADTAFNGNGFMSIPVIDTNTYSAVLAGAIESDGSILLALLARGSFNVDLVGWSPPVMVGNPQSPTTPGTMTPPAALTVGGSAANAAPVGQSDGSILISAQTAANDEVLFELHGDANLGFNVSAPASFNCPAPVTVPNVVGMTQAAATSAITGAGLTVGTVTQQPSSTVPSGSVISENPIAGTRVPRGSPVNLIISTGPTAVTVPNVVGMTQAAASSAITGAGLTVGTVTMQSSNTVPSGSVISESPAAGTSVASGSAVNLVVSSGPSPSGVTVPNVVGMTQAAASSAITGAGLTVGTVTMQSSNTVTSGSVISESPAAGTSVASGSAVDLVVSAGASAGQTGTGSSGGGGAFDSFTLGALIGFLALGLRRGRRARRID